MPWGLIIISRQRILTKNRMECRDVIENLIISFAACHCSRWKLNYPFFLRTPMPIIFSGPDKRKYCPFPWGSRPLLIHGSLGPRYSAPQVASKSVQPFLQGSRTWPTNKQTHTHIHTDKHTDTRTDHATPSVIRDCILYNGCDAA